VSRSSSAKRRLFSLSCNDAAEEPLLPPFLAKPRPSHRQVAVTGVALLLLLALCGVDDLVAGDSSSNGHGLVQHTRRYLLADTGEAAAATSAAPPGSAPATSLAVDSAVIMTFAALGWRSSQQPLWNVSFTASFLCPGRHDAAAAAVPEAAVRADFVSHLMPVASLLAGESCDCSRFLPRLQKFACFELPRFISHSWRAWHEIPRFRLPLTLFCLGLRLCPPLSGSPTVATVVSWQPRAAGSSSSSRRDCRTATVSLLLPQQPGLALAAALGADPLLLLGPNSSGKDGREAAVWVSHLCCKGEWRCRKGGTQPCCGSRLLDAARFTVV
jgi:hypothetical protein